MKKVNFIILIFIMSFKAHSQLIDNFELTLDTNHWIRRTTNLYNAPLLKEWELQQPPFSPIHGFGSAYIDRENISANNIAEYWLISMPISIDNNEELSFWGKQTITGDQGSKYEIWITDGAQNDYSSYTKVAWWTESEYASATTANVEKIVPLDDYAGATIHIAFVKRDMQLQAAIGADRWLIDDVRIQNHPLSIESQKDSSFKIYPNPTSNSWNFSSENETIDNIKIIDILGKIIISTFPKNTEAIIDASILEKGIYFAEITTTTKIDKIPLLKK